MKKIMSFVYGLLILNFPHALAQENQSPKELQCVEGNFRLHVDFLAKKVGIFETDSFTQIEHNIFGFNHDVRSYKISLAKPSLAYYALDLKIKNDGLLKGKFKLEADPVLKERKGVIQYEGWFSWEPIFFSECVLLY